jgi:hypothetical protein
MRRMLTMMPAIVLLLMSIATEAASPLIGSARKKPPRKVKTVIEMSPAELLKKYRNELSDVQFSPMQDELNAILEASGQRVNAFIRDLPSISAKEHVLQRKFPANNRLSAAIVESTQQVESTFDYQIVPRPELGAVLPIEEFRSEPKTRTVSASVGYDLIMSRNYASLCLYLHPSHQSKSHFRYLGRQKKGPVADVIAFAQRPESSDYLAQFWAPRSSQPVRFLVQGFVWLDPETRQILRVRTTLLKPEQPTVLRDQVTDAVYDGVDFADGHRFWVPLEVNVSWEFDDLIFRNQPVYIDSHLNRAMPHLAHDVVDIFLLGELERSERMAELMPANLSDNRLTFRCALLFGILKHLGKTPLGDIIGA